MDLTQVQRAVLDAQSVSQLMDTYRWHGFQEGKYNTVVWKEIIKRELFIWKYSNKGYEPRVQKPETCRL